ncbi:MAG: hypothetical protein JWN17_2099 [Frankiales bacterium]|nr:hypothetical protein [Frankiales bacterium]
MRLPLPLLGALSGVLLLSACSHDAAAPAAFPLPATSSFDAGTCTVVAPDVVALGRAARRLGPGPTAPDGVEKDLETAQKALQAVAETAEPALKPTLDAVVTRAGLVRLALDAKRYDATMAEPLRQSYGALVKTCTSS